MQMKRGTYVRVIPLRPRSNFIVDFIDGKPKPRSMRPYLWGHYMEGSLKDDLVQGARIWFEGSHLRNGVLVEDSWRSTRIICVVGDHVCSEMGKYRILQVPPYHLPPSHPLVL
jgi:hypothetical protein